MFRFIFDGQAGQDLFGPVVDGLVLEPHPEKTVISHDHHEQPFAVRDDVDDFLLADLVDLFLAEMEIEVDDVASIGADPEVVPEFSDAGDVLLLARADDIDGQQLASLH